MSSVGGKQNRADSKIHYLSSYNPNLVSSYSRSNPSEFQKSKHKRKVKESKKIDINIDFINNGKPYFNSKKSKMMTRMKKRKSSPTSKHQVSSDKEKVDPSSHAFQHIFDDTVNVRYEENDINSLEIEEIKGLSVTSHINSWSHYIHNPQHMHKKLNFEIFKH